MLETRQDPPEETKERAALEKEMADLRKANSLVKNPQKALAAERKRRWEESKKRRAENKKKCAAEQKQRAEKYAAFRTTTIVHAGAKANKAALPADVPWNTSGA